MHLTQFLFYFIFFLFFLWSLAALEWISIQIYFSPIYLFKSLELYETVLVYLALEKMSAVSNCVVRTNVSLDSQLRACVSLAYVIECSRFLFVRFASWCVPNHLFACDLLRVCMCVRCWSVCVSLNCLFKPPHCYRPTDRNNACIVLQCVRACF